VRLREWSEADFYADLGVSPAATRDEIIAAYRARARELHPDAAPSDPAAEDQFNRVAIAYRVLTGPRRSEYDAARERARAVAAVAARPAARAPVPKRESGHLTRQGARWALFGGLALVVGGLIGAVVVTLIQVHDADLRSKGVPVDALVVADGGSRELEFTTRSGDVVRTGIPDSKSGGVVAGDTVAIRYDADDPQRVVTAANTIARDITLWIVVAKFLIVGTVLAIIGARRLARPPGVDDGREMTHVSDVKHLRSGTRRA
jgi:hypothetical protein